MFSWLKTKSPREREREQEQEQAALDTMLAEFRRETSYIDDKWLPETRQAYADKVAGAWRDYLASLDAKCGEHGVDRLSQLPADARIEIGNVLAETMIAAHERCGKLRTETAPSPEYLDAMCMMYSCKHVGSFVTAMSMDRHELAGQYAGQLDAYLASGSGAKTTFSEFLEAQGR